MGEPAYMPSPSQIRAACAEIQAEWTDDERYRRMTVKPRDDWHPPVIHADEDLEYERERGSVQLTRGADE